MSGVNHLSTIKQQVRLSDIISQTLPIKRQKEGEFLGKCPFHNDYDPSLRIYDATGKYWCFGCQANGDVFDWLESQRGMNIQESKEYLGMNDVKFKDTVIPIKDSVIPFPTTKDSDEYYGADKDGVIGWHKLFHDGYSTIHYYYDGSGNILYKIARYEKTADRKKYFIPATHTKDGWVNKAPTEGRVLYNIGSLKNKGIGFIFEGEKCVNVAMEMLKNRALITWMGGSGALDKLDNTPLKDGRKWVYWPDNDEGGKKTAAYLASIIPDLYVVPIPEGKKKGWDLADAVLIDGWTENDVIALLNKKVLYRDLNPIPVDHPTEEIFTLPGKMPGLCGEIEEYMNATSTQKQPIYAANATLAIVGALKAHRVCTERKGMTNYYGVSIGTTGSGKDHPLVCQEEINSQCEINLILETPASGPGLITSLKRQKGRALLQIDEIGLFLSNINNKNSGGYQKEIIDNIMMLYSSTKKIFREKGYAVARNDKVEDRQIVKPCLSLYGTSVPDNFFENLSEISATNGLLSRIIIVASDNNGLQEVEAEYDVEDIPDSIIEKIQIINDMPTCNMIPCAPEDLPKTEKDIQRIQNSIKPKVIPMTKEAKEILVAYKEKSITIRERLLAKNNPLASLWVRLSENASKVALIISDGDFITDKEMQWACEWVMYWTHNTVNQIALHTSENEYDKRLKHLLRIIGKKEDGLTKSEIINLTKYGKKIREELLDDLIEAERIEKVIHSSGTKNLITYKLR